MVYKISVDTGGTFTDVIVMDEAGVQTIGKSLTTPDRIFSGMRGALENAAAQLGLSMSEMLQKTRLLIYGTTRSLNAIVTRTTAKTAFLTTKGFPDTLVLKEGGKLNPHDFSRDYPGPYIPRRYTFEITERTNSEGELLVALDEVQARSVIERLRDESFEAVAVSFLWSAVNPAHELKMGAMLKDALPDIPFTLSHQLLPIIGEYRRASATAIDASLKPLMQKHLREMEEDIRATDYQGEILVGTIAGGVVHVEELIERPIYTVKSGPAMAPIAALTYARSEGLNADAIVCDTGGTTFDVGLVRGGQLTYTRETWLGEPWQGHIVAVSSVDVRSVGAGGGSIAWLDAGGLLRVGPHSAGANPGPACYGHGGDQPTVTDAATFLGYLNPDNFLAGRMRLNVDAARSVIETLAAKIDLSPEDTAYAIIQLSSELMIKAISEITIREGVDPRESTLVAGGGAAGLNIMPIARELGCDTVLLPRTAGALSASGMQFSNITTDRSKSLVTSSDRFDYDRVNRVLAEMRQDLDEVADQLKSKGLTDYTIDYFIDARYRHQVWELETPLAYGVIDPDQMPAIVESFHRIHEDVFAVRDTDSAVEFLNWKARLTVFLKSIPPQRAQERVKAAATPASYRRAYFQSEGAVDTPIFRGQELAAGARIQGPAIIEEPTTTIVVYPGGRAEVSDASNYILTTRG